MEGVFSKMCRLMGYVSQSESSFPAQVGKDFEELLAYKFIFDAIKDKETVSC